ncbi:FAD-dependent oxidoreductase [Antrihabitans sp. YC2-6]|uniref:FAD-dependent oxidoreductase n=1 Tax=Antrihabitans sp. YC2-6 TaxID=2799498 RepID=UPI0018F7B96D|nr:FAD-dependent oxidoreductase [Antrihabitans sp. YC2-6]MBJ8346671.1 FAD-binding oxidoreductase [Antrihabitans sp. YC2-6]
MTTPHVVVVGSGVIGLSSALELARSGKRVTVIADRKPAETVSAVAAAIWEPYDAFPRDAVLQWSLDALATFTELAADPATGVHLREGVSVQREPGKKAWWAGGVVEARPARPEELPDGAVSGEVCTVPVIVMPVYLEWLMRSCEANGVLFEWRTLATLEEVGHGSSPIVVAAGLRAGELVAGEQLVPVRGQIVRLANPGLTRWYIDEDNAGGCTYIIPRVDDVICGGTNEPGVADSVPDPAVAEAILARARRLEPRLADAEVLADVVGFRPGRESVRLDATEHSGRLVVHCYGHGGAGVTTSWGAARDVVRLVDGTPIQISHNSNFSRSAT